MPKAKVPGFIACGKDDAERLRISRDFAYQYREAGGLLLWKPVKSGHELNSHALALSREFFATVAHGAPCSLWGEDDTRQIKPCDRIDVEFRNPLYNSRIADLWRRKVVVHCHLGRAARPQVSAARRGQRAPPGFAIAFVAQVPLEFRLRESGNFFFFFKNLNLI